MSVFSADYADLLEGKPDRLEPEAQALVTAADAILRATESLRGLIEGQTSRSTDALAETASEVARSLSKARTRYRKTGEALQVYAADLRPIQRDARDAIAEAEFYDRKTASLPHDIADREGDLLRAEAAEAAPARIQAIEDDLWRLRNEQGRAHSEVDDARRRLNSARDRLRQIADTAIASIETAIEGESDSLADNWNQFWEAAAGWIGEWAASVLKGILEFLGELLAVLVAIVVIVLLIVVVALVLSVIAATIGWIALAAIAALTVAALLLTFLIRDGLGSPIRRSPAPGDKPQPRTKYPSDADDATSAEDYTSEDYGDLIEEVGRQDALGGEQRTVVRVVAITDADGNVIGYRVQLPSTQNWSPFNADGALNDLSADAMLALFPGLETQYEKAVWDALQASGALNSDAPIMLTGWSLGGMMAGDLAADPRLEGRVQSLVTAGSAVDKHAGEIDPSVRVTQINNRWDPVHTLEFAGYDSDDVPGDNWQVHHPVDIRIHDSTMYGELADDVIPQVRPGDEIFFADDVGGTHEEVYEMVYSRG
jgi:hypothetical protein